jgi:hypothetical protein
MTYSVWTELYGQLILAGLESYMCRHNEAPNARRASRGFQRSTTAEKSAGLTNHGHPRYTERAAIHGHAVFHLLPLVSPYQPENPVRGSYQPCHAIARSRTVLSR